MGNPWDMNERAPSASSHQTPNRDNDWEAPFPAPEPTNVTEAPTFRFQEQSLEQITGQFQAFRPDQGQQTEDPFAAGIAPVPQSPQHAQNDPLQQYLIDKENERAQFQNGQGYQPNAPQPARTQPTAAFTPQPAIESNARLSNSGQYRAISNQPNTYQYRPTPPPPSQPLISQTSFERSKHAPVQKAETNAEYRVQQDMLLAPFSQEDLLAYEEKVIPLHSATTPEVRAPERQEPIDSLIYRHSSLLREDLSTPLGANHITFLKGEENYAAEWESQDSLDAVNQQEKLGYIKAGKSLLDSFERIVFPGPNGELPSYSFKHEEPELPFNPFDPSAQSMTIPQTSQETAEMLRNRGFGPAPVADNHNNYYGDRIDLGVQIDHKHPQFGTQPNRERIQSAMLAHRRTPGFFGRIMNFFRGLFS